MDDIPWGDPPPPQIATAKARKCRHLGGRVTKQIASEPEPVYAAVCVRCGHVFDEAKRKKGRQVNNLGKAIERWVGKTLRLRRVGQYGGAEDLDGWAFVQVKSGPAWFSERQYREIEALPVVAGRRRALVTVEKPGADAGRRRRALWIELLDDIDPPIPAVCDPCGKRWPEHEPYCVYAQKF